MASAPRSGPPLPVFASERLEASTRSGSCHIGPPRPSFAASEYESGPWTWPGTVKTVLCSHRTLKPTPKASRSERTELTQFNFVIHGGEGMGTTRILATKQTALLLVFFTVAAGRQVSARSATRLRGAGTTRFHHFDLRQSTSNFSPAALPPGWGEVRSG